MLKSLASGIHERAHSARADLLLRLLQPARGSRILDLGGGDGSYAARIAARTGAWVVLADLAESDGLARNRHGFETATLAEEGPLPFGDGAFDIVLCNSVLEHVTVSKEEAVSQRFSEQDWRALAFEHQRRFAGEIARVGRGYFVQTPHRAFPIDAHTWRSFTNLLPHEALRRLVRVTDRVWVKYCGYADWSLLNVRDMRQLFPDARIHVERFAGLPKSIIAFRSPP